MWQIFIADQAVLSSVGEDGLPRGWGAIKQSIPLVAGGVVLEAVVRKPVNTAYFEVILLAPQKYAWEITLTLVGGGEGGCWDFPF